MIVVVTVLHPPYLRGATTFLLMPEPESTVLVSPRTLSWARIDMGLELDGAAEASGIQVADLKGFEAGKKSPTYRQLRKLARTYQRPVAVLLMEDPPETSSPADFRGAAGQATRMSPELLLAIRDARGQRQIALDLARELGREFTFAAPEISLEETPDAAAAKLRSWLDIDPIAAGARGNSAYRFWRTRFEEKGILALQFSGIETAEASGFSIAASPLPVVSVNSKEHERRRLFTLFHELAHVALGHASAVCHLDDGNDTEVFCNAVAGRALVPNELLLKNKWVAEANAETEWNDYRLSRLAAPYGVSREMVLRRLMDLAKTSKGFYAQRRRLYQQRFVEQQREEAERKRRKREQGHPFTGPPPAVVQRSRLGNLYSRLALEAYETGSSTLHETCERLGLSVGQTKRLQAELYRRTG